MSDPLICAVAPRDPALETCRFYHAFDEIEGAMGAEWDLRADPRGYLGHVDFKGKSVLEVGPASGFLSFHMEHAGAQVTCLEPPMQHLWDMVPCDGFDMAAWRKEFEPSIASVRNSFWYMHRLRQSRVTLLEGDAYRLPDALGPFDAGVLAAVLMHCRNPFDMLQSVASKVRKTMVITELYNPALGELPVCQFLPHRAAQQVHTWWYFTPQFFVSALGLLGFTDCRVYHHQQRQPAENRDVPMYTVVCERPNDSA